MNQSNDKILRRLDALLGIAIALTQLKGSGEGASLSNVRYLRSLGFPNTEIAAILGTSVHHIENQASRLIREGKLKRTKGR